MNCSVSKQIANHPTAKAEAIRNLEKVRKVEAAVDHVLLRALNCTILRVPVRSHSQRNQASDVATDRGEGESPPTRKWTGVGGGHVG